MNWVLFFVYPPLFNHGILGGLGKKFLRHIEILLSPTCFLGFQKEWRGVLRMPQFSREIFLERVKPPPFLIYFSFCPPHSPTPLLKGW
jgi:hypothetical protein